MASSIPPTDPLNPLSSLNPSIKRKPLTPTSGGAAGATATLPLPDVISGQGETGRDWAKDTAADIEHVESTTATRRGAPPAPATTMESLRPEELGKGIMNPGLDPMAAQPGAKGFDQGGGDTIPTGTASTAQGGHREGGAEGGDDEEELLPPGAYIPDPEADGGMRAPRKDEQGWSLMDTVKDYTARAGHHGHRHKRGRGHRADDAAAAAAPGGGGGIAAVGADILASTTQTLSNAGHTVASYLPGHNKPTMTTTWTHSPTSLPSSESPSTSPVGVGSLPGNISEVSVAKTPEERRTEGLPSHDYDRDIGHGKDRGHRGGVGVLPGTPEETGIGLCAEERVHPESEIYAASKTSDSQMVPTPEEAGTKAESDTSPQDSEEKQDAIGRGIGIGAGVAAGGLGLGLGGAALGRGTHGEGGEVPGPASTNLAETSSGPAEKGVAAATAVAEPGGTPVGSMSGGTGAVEGRAEGEAANTTACPPGLGLGDCATGVAGPAGAGSSGPSAGGTSPGMAPGTPSTALSSGAGVGGETDIGKHDPDVVSPVESAASPATGPSSQAQRDSGSGSGSGSGSRMSGGSGQEREKVKFMDKIKGEAKVLSGKIGRDQKKVEEGRRMMGRE